MIVRKRDGNRLCRFPFFCVERRGEEKEKKKKSESGNVLAGQAGMEVIDWRRIVMLV